MNLKSDRLAFWQRILHRNAYLNGWIQDAEGEEELVHTTPMRLLQVPKT